MEAARHGLYFLRLCMPRKELAADDPIVVKGVFSRIGIVKGCPALAALVHKARTLLAC